MRYFWIVVLLGCLVGQEVAPAASLGVWANSGEDKVAREELRYTRDRRDVRNAVFNGRGVTLFAGGGETVSMNIVIESPEVDVSDVTVAASDLVAAGGSAAGQSAAGQSAALGEGTIRSTPRGDAEGLFDYRGRDIELFYVRYLKIEGCSTLSYEHFDERHVPARFQRPHDGQGFAEGGWTDRPDHDRHYPEIAAPIELHQGFTIRGGSNQSIWADVYVPPATPPGVYRGRVTIEAKEIDPLVLPVQLRVLDWRLPELPTARTMLYVSREDINRRYTGKRYLDEATAAEISLADRVLDRHFQMAHRHRVSLIHEHTPIGVVDQLWRRKLDGSLFTADRGYEGPGVGVGNNVFSIGTYGNWPWKDNGREVMWRSTDRWMKYFEDANFETPTDPFLYLIDESDEFAKIETWAGWVKSNPGPGGKLLTLATAPMPATMKNAPSLTLPCSTVSYGVTEDWTAALQHYRDRDDATFWLYNGGRVGSGSLATEDDGVAMRTLGWCQYKFRVPRWFVWQGTYYENFQGGTGETKLYSSAHTFGGSTRDDPVLGRTGGNYNNGDGVLFYPGTDKVYVEESYGIEGPIASLRLKHWRRGLQDHEYLVAAAKVDSAAVDAIVNSVVPKVLWEVGVSEREDPTYVRSDIHWPVDPDRWHEARVKLAKIIVGAESGNSVSGGSGP